QQKESGHVRKFKAIDEKMTTQKILVTGGAGYIGSHCVIELIKSGYVPVVIDNFHNAIRGEDGVPESIRRVSKITGADIIFREIDLLDESALHNLFKEHNFSAVIHFAGLKAVGESVQKPLLYYKVNLTGTIKLLEVSVLTPEGGESFIRKMNLCGGKEIILLNLRFTCNSCAEDWNAVLLRYFNPIGAHESGRIGEDPQGIPNNLMPYISQVAIGRRQCLNVFGNDYETCDGTGVRDYIHVVDLAKGHIAALKKLKERCSCKVYNLGTGTGYSVLQMVKAMEKASGREIKYQIVSRREGDISSCFADPTLAEKELGWKAQFGIDKMCQDLWHWQSQNPYGFGKNETPNATSNS
ncbi:hypothetical protein scyTo_0007694, partial [Scyliorhinus torazame]|nr:hypothetical protein [Scyliorhinus torazame]